MMQAAAERRHTRSLIVLAPTVLMMWSTSCKMKMTRSSDAMLKAFRFFRDERNKY
jgi:hypothetical protein